jgi:hypothetical protein
MDECSLKTNTQVTYMQRIPNLMKINPSKKDHCPQLKGKTFIN